MTNTIYRRLALRPRPITDLGTWDIREYLRLPGDKVYRIPDGAYYGGDCTDADHPATGGRFNGAPVLKPASPFGATIYQSPPGIALPGGLATANGDLRLGGTSKRIIMVGFNWQDGTVRPSGNTTASGPLLRLWWNKLKFDATTWAAESGHTNTSGGFYHQYHDAPRTIDCRGLSGSGNFPGVLGFYGCNFGPTGTAFFPGGASATGHVVDLVGCDLASLDDGGSALDPLDINHPDGFAGVGGTVTLNIVDSYIHPGRGHNDVTGIIMQEHFGNAVLNATRVWITGSGGPGINLQGDNGHNISGTFVDTYVWDNYPTTDPDENAWDYIKNAVNGSTITMTETGLHLHTAHAPSGSDPMTLWRAAAGHGYEDYESYLSGIGYL